MQTAPDNPPKPVRVVVVDLDVSFGQLVSLLVKTALAAIPALLILLCVGVFVWLLLLLLLRL